MKNEFICECDQCGEWFRKKDCLFCEEKPKQVIKVEQKNINDDRHRDTKKAQ